MTIQKRALEVSQLRYRADELMKSGDIVSAIMLDEFAHMIQAGKEWNDIIDDVEVLETRPPYTA